jgi:hypothetical protein
MQLLRELMHEDNNGWSYLLRRTSLPVRNEKAASVPYLKLPIRRFFVSRVY